MNKWVVLFVFLGLVGCTTTDPYTGERQASNTAKGAGVGAVAGAVIGAASASKSDRRRGAITGAVAGGAIGGSVGYYMDRQEAELRKQLQGSGVQVRREGDVIYLVMPGNITFDVNGDTIRSDFFNVLNSVALVLKEYDKTIIKASGHTDSTGSDAINNPLSERRAESVRQYLIGQKVSHNRIQAIGYGSRYPVASNATAEGRQANRRVELELIPME
jgi:outer membrane protein OmpA-like peptidoglycan-associated protein